MRQERFLTEPQHTAPPAQSLAGVLDLLFPEGSAPPADFSGRLAQLLMDLTAARTVTLLADTPDGPVIAFAGGAPNEEAARALASRSIAAPSVYAEGSWLACDLRTRETSTMIAVLDMSGANRLALAMASERLELMRALCRAAALGQRFRPTPALLALATQIASGKWDNAQAFIDALSQITGEIDLGIAQIAGRRARDVWCSGQAEISHRSTLRQAHLDRVNAALVTPTPDPGVCLLGTPPHAAILSPKNCELAESAAQTLHALFATPRHRLGFGRLVRNIAIWSVLCIAIAGALLLPIADTVNLPARVEATDRRAVTAPFDGRVDAILVKDGAQVIAGETLLGQMDTTDIDRTLTDLRTQQLSAISKRDAARGERNAAEIREAELNIQLLSVRIEAAEARRNYARLYAPIDGLVQIPDGPNKVGAFVGLGAPLMEVISRTNKRIVMDVSAPARSKIKDQASGEFRSEALPNKVVPFQLLTVSLIAYPPESQTHLGRSQALEPSETQFLVNGMQGVASFELGREPLGVLLWKRFRDWAIVTFWM